MSGVPPRKAPPLPPPRNSNANGTVTTLQTQPDKEVIAPRFYQYKPPEYTVLPPVSGVLEMHEEGQVEKLYSLGKFLGCGGFAEVYHAVHNETSNEYAVKVIDKVLSMEGDPNAILMEIQIMKSNSHSNIIKFVEAYETPFRVYIVMEYLGEPLANIENRSQYLRDGVWVLPYGEKVLQHIVRLMLKALFDLHSRGILHRDVKPENMLWVTKPTTQDISNETCHIKLIDFGMAIYFPKEGPLLQWVGTTDFQAPEMVSQSPKGYDFKADMWSFGITLYFLVVGNLPFEDKNRMMVMLKIKKAEFSLDQPQWNNYHQLFKDLVKSLLCTDPEQRISAEQALDHPWLSI